MTDEFVATNKDLWETWTAHGFSPAFAKLEAFRSGEEILQDFEIAEVGDVTGRSLLHLQCHFGLDTLAWAKRGAVATGVDFAERSIDLARSLAEELDVEARFVCSDVLRLTEELDETFDIVYTSFGVLAWMSDLQKWAGVIARFLKPGGFFYIAEYHPITFCFDDKPSEEIVFRHPYFHRPEPVRFEAGGVGELYGWPYNLGAVVTALTGAGLDVEFLRELPFSESQHSPILEPGRVGEEKGKWYLPERIEGELPLMFSLRARKGA